MKGRTWKATSVEALGPLREFLLKLGGIEDKDLKSSHELWRIRYAGSVFTAYRSGSIYCNGGDAPELPFLYEQISNMLGQQLEVPAREILIGLDETGKGEVLGHSALAAVRITSSSIPALDKILGSIDTKTRKQFGFWDQVIKELDQLRGVGLEYEVETIPPWDVDRYNINKIQDVVYQRLLGRLLRGASPNSVRVVIDDYGIGMNLGAFLQSLHKAGAEVRVEARADERYVEVRAAAVVSKWRRELAMKRINERFSLENTPVGSGNAGDQLTKAWLDRWKATGQPWPWFVKTSYSTIRELDGRSGRAVKEDPPIRHELLSPDSTRSFREGKLSTASLAIVCPSCGTIGTAAKLTPEGNGELVGRCVSCQEIILDLDTTLRYYSGFLVPDASVILAGTVSKDLDRRGFFGGFTFLLHPVVRAETDTPGGKAELAKLGDFAAMGRIALNGVSGTVPSDRELRDPAVIECARSQDAILLTRDRGMYGNAVAERVFCLTLKT